VVLTAPALPGKAAHICTANILFEFLLTSPREVNLMGTTLCAVCRPSEGIGTENDRHEPGKGRPATADKGLATRVGLRMCTAPWKWAEGNQRD
jgi:hypothetical protein